MYMQFHMADQLGLVVQDVECITFAKNNTNTQYTHLKCRAALDHEHMQSHERLMYCQSQDES